MKKVNTNVKEFRPHIRWILRKMGLRSYDVMVGFLSVKDCRKIGLIPKEAKGWTAFFVPPNIVWIGASVVQRGRWWMMHVLSHELRHYYQCKTKKFPMVESSTPMDHRKMNRKEGKKYLKDKREKDAVEFQLWFMDSLESDPKTCRRLGI